MSVSLPGCGVAAGASRLALGLGPGAACVCCRLGSAAGSSTSTISHCTLHTLQTLQTVQCASAHLAVEVVQVPGQDASDAVHLLREEGPAGGPRVHADPGTRRTKTVTQGQLGTSLLEIHLKYLSVYVVCLFVLAA